MSRTIEPDDNAPCMLVLIGNDAKATCLKSFGVKDTVGSVSRPPGEIHLHLDYMQNTIPVLIGDGDMPSQRRTHRLLKTSACHAMTDLPLGEAAHLCTGREGKARHVYHRLLYSFADVFCCFATDLGGIDHLCQTLSNWASCGAPSTLSILPQLVVVVDDVDEKPVVEAVLKSQDLTTMFSTIQVITVGRTSMDKKQLKRAVVSAALEVRHERQERRLLFSARHFLAFFHASVESSLKRPLGQFDFIAVARASNPVARNLDAHLSNFLTKIPDPDDVRNFAVQTIASALLLDSYPPGMHRFDPRDIFAALYRDVCYHMGATKVLAGPGSRYMILPTSFARMVETEMARLFDRLGRLGAEPSAKSLHVETLSRYRQKWKEIYSNETCFVCLRREPQQLDLRCGHRICETCMIIFWSTGKRGSHLFNIQRCLLCDEDTSGTVVGVKPSTAGVRIFSVDGGGTRAKIPLEFIREIQERLPYPIQENFDVAFGTSSGALIIFALIICGWPVEKCISCFEAFARVAFRPRWGFFSTLYGLLVDGQYSPHHIEVALRGVFGSRRSLSDYSKASETGCKVGMPVTTMDNKTRIFTNYSAAGERDVNSGYDVLKPPRRVPLWEIARCGTAAPYFFKPRVIPGLGKFYDGGVWKNNPAILAGEEARKLYPRSKEPSLFVSCGTGFGGPRTPAERTGSIWEDNFVVRMFRTFLLYMSGSRLWSEFMGHRQIGARGQYFRFDLEFSGPEPRLDDVSKMDELSQAARQAISKSPELDRLVRSMVAELFFFELDQVPSRRNGVLTCSGHLFCRLKAGSAALFGLLRMLNANDTRLMVRRRVLSGSFQGRYVLDEADNFSRRIVVEMPSMHDAFSISLRFKSGDEHTISGAPFSLAWLVSAQELDAPFGTASHLKRKASDDPHGLRPKRRRAM